MLLALCVIVLIAGVCGFYAWNSSQPIFTSKAKDGVKKTVEKAVDVVDVNNDGKVDIKDVIKVAKAAKAEAGRVKKKYGGKVKKASKTA
jgi:hypothetical protein